MHITLPTTKPSEGAVMLGKKTIQIKTTVNILGEHVSSLPVVNCKFQLPTVRWGERNVANASTDAYISDHLHQLL